MFYTINIEDNVRLDAIWYHAIKFNLLGGTFEDPLFWFHTSGRPVVSVHGQLYVEGMDFSILPDHTYDFNKRGTARLVIQGGYGVQLLPASIQLDSAMVMYALDREDERLQREYHADAQDECDGDCSDCPVTDCIPF